MNAPDGGFTQTTYTTIGDDFDKVKVKDFRGKGLNFVTNPPRTGIDGMFTKKFFSLHQGDPYVDPGVQERRAKVENERKRVAGAPPFKYTNPTHDPNGLGSYFGCFNEKQPYPHETDYVVLRKGQKAEKHVFAPRNIYTSKPKLGTYGFTGTSLNKTGLNYIADFYEANKSKAKEERLESHKKMPSVPFKSAARTGGTFDQKTGTGASQVYAMTKAMPKQKPKISKAILVREGVPAWKPNSFALKELKVEYREDPYELKDSKAKTERVKNTPVAPWKPVSIQKSKFTKSVAFGNLRV